MTTDPAFPPRILIIERDHALRHCLRLHLELNHCVCETAADVPSVVERANLHAYDLVITGLTPRAGEAQMLVHAVRALRQRAYIPVLILATEATRAAAIISLENGADAFLVKPFGFREFVARVRSLLRPRSEGLREHRVYAGAVEVEPARRRARVDGRDVRLTEQEFQLLYILASNADRVLSRASLLSRVWGDTFVSVRSVDALVKRLRRRLEATAGRPAGIQTVRGVGYRLSSSALQRSA